MAKEKKIEFPNPNFQLYERVDDEKHMLKAVEKVINSDTVKAVHIVDSTVKETLYGMSEQDFITFAKVLPPRNSADGETSDTAEDEQI